MGSSYVIGVDFGTDSVRSIIVDTADGREISQSEFLYPRWKEGLYCDPKENRFRQHPLDYIEGIEFSIVDAIRKAPKGTAGFVKGISVDTTGSTPVAVDRNGTPLALVNGFENNPNSMFILWKDHTAVAEAEEINKKSKSWGGPDYTKFSGGIYSSEWFWSKILHVLRDDEKVRSAAYSWVEHCDWITALLTGETDPKKIKRSRCAAGHKAMWHAEFNGLPSDDFLSSVDPLLKGLRENLYSETYTSDICAGKISKEWAQKLGLPDDISIGVGAFDAHMGAVGGGIEPYYLSKVMGTSTCDIMMAPNEDMKNKIVRGICGQVDGSIIPGMLGMEAGQSAFGDVFAWFRKLLLWPVENIISESDLNNSQTKKIMIEVLEKVGRTTA